MRRSTVLAAVAAFCGLGIGAQPAAATSYFYANHYGPLTAGYSQPAFASIYVLNVRAMNGQSTGSAFSGVWVVNGSQVRVSEDAFCTSPGCVAGNAWPGARPDGYPIVHNHGNASPSYFNGSAND